MSKKYSIGSDSQLRRWVNVYKDFGDEGLLRSRKNKQYSFEFRLLVVELYLSSEVSYQELASSQGINNSSFITRWVNCLDLSVNVESVVSLKRKRH